MNTQKRNEFVDNLLNATIAGSVHWEKTPDEQTFQTSIGRYVVSIIDVRDGPPFLTLTNASGELVERIQFRDMVDFSDDAGPALKRLNDLFREARSGAMGADKALDSILGELRNRKGSSPSDSPDL